MPLRIIILKNWNDQVFGTIIVVPAICFKLKVGDAQEPIWVTQNSLSLMRFDFKYSSTYLRRITCLAKKSVITIDVLSSLTQICQSKLEHYCLLISMVATSINILINYAHTVFNSLCVNMTSKGVSLSVV